MNHLKKFNTFLLPKLSHKRTNKVILCINLYYKDFYLTVKANKG